MKNINAFVKLWFGKIIQEHNKENEGNEKNKARQKIIGDVVVTSLDVRNEGSLKF